MKIANGVTVLNEKDLYEINGGAISGAALGGLAVKAAIGGATVLGGIALGAGVVVGSWYLLNKLNNEGNEG